MRGKPIDSLSSLINTTSRCVMSGQMDPKDEKKAIELVGVVIKEVTQEMQGQLTVDQNASDTLGEKPTDGLSETAKGIRRKIAGPQEC